MMASITVKNLSKRYKIGRGLPSFWSLLGKQNNAVSGQYHWAVKDVNFEIQPGEALGIIGPNGAGKTTILKLLSSVTKPSSGEIKVHGRFSALIELGAGFHPDLTGRENIYLNGTILGMSRSEIKSRFDEIVDFAGIQEYLDTPVKRYSSGMYARLGFSIAAHVDPDVMLVDEVLAVGDFAFQTKCHERMDELRRNGTSLIFVSHNMEAVQRVCDRGMVMYRGQAIFQGNAPEAVVAYSEAIREAARQQKVSVPKERGLSHRVMTFDAEIEGASLIDENGRPITIVEPGEKGIISMDIIFHRQVCNPIFGLVVRTFSGQRVYVTTTKWQGMETPEFSAGEQCRVEFHLDFPLLEGVYEFGVDVAASDLSHYYDRIERVMSFNVAGSKKDKAKGLVDLGAEVVITKPEVTFNGRDA
jgi:lipopolysaccharide transport system ATP-binding protein